jgi:MOSC domain-containing protein YiiM
MFRVMDTQGRVEAIFLASTNGGPVHEVASAVAHPGRGLEGDRHFDDAGACDITLIESEALETLAASHGLELGAGESRRQVQVRAVNLRDYIGRQFRVGEIECQGEEHCEPCSHLAGLLETDAVLKGLLHTGLRATILKGGTIRAGDAVELVGQPAQL